MRKWFIYSDLRDRRVYASDGWRAEAPTFVWFTHEVLWDHPEIIPEYAKALVYRAWKVNRKLEGI